MTEYDKEYQFQNEREYNMLGIGVHEYSSNPMDTNYKWECLLNKVTFIASEQEQLG